jgi:integrase
MPRRPEIGNVQLYPNRPLKTSDRNGYVLKFYCPIRKARVRKNTGARDRREARRIQRDCRERLLNGEYVSSGGAITATHQSGASPLVPPSTTRNGRGWDECRDEYRRQRAIRLRKSSFDNAMSRLDIAGQVFASYFKERGRMEGFAVSDVMTLPMLEYLQDRLLSGETSRLGQRSVNTVNSIMAGVMSFVRFCHRRGWIETVPPVERLDVDNVMHGRPVTEEEFGRMLQATSKVVGKNHAESWQFTLRVIWESGFRVADVMDFAWDDDQHIRPKWTDLGHPTIIIPSTQKNGRQQEVPMLPGLCQLLDSVPVEHRVGWVVNPLTKESLGEGTPTGSRPAAKDLRQLANRWSNSSIAKACGVSETSIRCWLKEARYSRTDNATQSAGPIPKEVVEAIRVRATQATRRLQGRFANRLTKERVGRVISMIGEEANVVVIRTDARTGKRQKFASAHDLRRGCAQRLINAGVSAETLKVVMRHRDFATTERHYGATRSAQAAAAEVHERLVTDAGRSAFVGGIVGGKTEAPRFTAEELLTLKALLKAI